MTGGCGKPHTVAEISGCPACSAFLLRDYARGRGLSVEEIIGWNLRRYRREHGMSGTRFGELLRAHLGSTWSRQAVSAAELGHRSFTAAELVALGSATGIPVEDLIAEPPCATCNGSAPHGFICHECGRLGS